MKDKLQFPFKRKGGNYLELLEDLGKDTMLGVKTVRATAKNTAIYFDDDGYTIQDAKKLARAIHDTYSDVTATADFGRNPYGEEVPFVFVDKVYSFMRESKMKKLNITKEAFEKSNYFKNKYGNLEYVSESGKLFKTNKGLVLKFKESIDDPDIKSAVRDAYDMYRNCDVEPKICHAIKINDDGTEKEIAIWMDRGNSIGGIAKAIQDGRLRKVIKFSESTKKFGKKFAKESVGDVATDPAYVCPYCGGDNCEISIGNDDLNLTYLDRLDGETFDVECWCNDCNKPYNVTVEMKVKDVHPEDWA